MAPVSTIHLFCSLALHSLHVVLVLFAQLFIGIGLRFLASSATTQASEGKLIESLSTASSIEGLAAEAGGFAEVLSDFLGRRPKRLMLASQRRFRLQSHHPLLHNVKQLVQRGLLVLCARRRSWRRNRFFERAIILRVFHCQCTQLFKGVFSGLDFFEL